MFARLLLAILLFASTMRTSAQPPTLTQPPTPTQPRPPAHTPNRIDSLSDTAAVLAFVQTQPHWVDGQLSYQEPLTKRNFVTNAYILRDRQQMDSFGQQPFEKADIDGNGYTDLLWNGYTGDLRMSLLILSFARDSFAVRILPKEWVEPRFSARFISVDGKTMIQTWGIYEYRGWKEERLDTLDLLFDLPAEREHPHQILNIDTLRFQVFPGGMDLAGGFQLSIVGDSLQLIKGHDAFPKSPIEGGGYFTARLDSITASRLKTVIESIDWDHIKEQYESGWSDQKTGYLLLSYDHGKRKKFADYGMKGTYRLSILESMLFDMLETQSWTDTNPGAPEFDYFPDGFSNQ